MTSRPTVAALATLVAALLPALPGTAQEPVAADPGDVSTLDGIIEAYYEVVSGPAGGVPDRERDRTLHLPGAVVGIPGQGPDGRPRVVTMSLDDYHDRFGQPRQEGFWEREIHREVRRFGNVAHVMSTYASSTTPDGEPFARGVNSIQLTWDGDRWWIVSWIFDQERPGNPLPADFLPGGVGDAAEAEARFRELEARLLGAGSVVVDFVVSAEGAAEIEVAGRLRKGEEGRIELRAEGRFGGQPVELLLATRGQMYEFGPATATTEAPRPPALWEALAVGLMRMGILHNLARLTGNAAPDHAEGGAAEWAVVDGFSAEEGAVAFDIAVAGRPAGSATLEMDGAGLPVVRRQSVQFPQGEMRVTERYSNVVVGG